MLGAEALGLVTFNTTLAPWVSGSGLAEPQFLLVALFRTDFPAATLQRNTEFVSTWFICVWKAKSTLCTF